MFASLVIRLLGEHVTVCQGPGGGGKAVVLDRLRLSSSLWCAPGLMELSRLAIVFLVRGWCAVVGRTSLAGLMKTVFSAGSLPPWQPVVIGQAAGKAGH